MIDFAELMDRDMEAVDSEDDRYQLPGQRSRAITLKKAPRARPPSIGDRKIQVLVLHGRQSNTNIAAFQASGLKGAFGKDVDLHYLDGCVVWQYKEGWDLHDADEMTKTLSKGKPFYDWFHHTTDDTKERLDIRRQQDPTANIYYQEPEKAVQKVMEFCCQRQSAGLPIDAVITIFEGAIVASMVIAHCVQTNHPIPWRMGVFFGALPIRDAKYSAFFEERVKEERKVDWPVMLVHGTHDEYYFYNRYGADKPMRSGKRILTQEEYYENPLIMEFCGGHSLPKGKEATTVFKRVEEEIKWHCGLSSRPPRKLARPLMPPSAPLLDFVMHVRKLRVVALCGGHSCTETLKFQCAQLRSALGKEYAEWVYMEGSKDWNYVKGEPILTDAEVRLAGGRQLKNWYADFTKPAGPDDDRLFRDLQFDPKLDCEYFKIPEVLEKLKEDLKKHEPIDVLVAFSQGAIVAQMLAGQMRKDGLDIPWRISLFFCGMHIRDRRLAHLVEEPFDVPSVHVYGKQDEFYNYQRDGFGTGKITEHCFVEPVILEHDQGHNFPTEEPAAGKIFKRCAEEVWKHCGGHPPALDLLGTGS